MIFSEYWMEMMDLCYCWVLLEDNEITGDNTEDTILPPDLIPLNEAQHQNPFDTSYSFTTLPPLASF